MIVPQRYFVLLLQVPYVCSEGNWKGTPVGNDVVCLIKKIFSQQDAARVVLLSALSIHLGSASNEDLDFNAH